jgi:uncharacterized protein
MAAKRLAVPSGAVLLAILISAVAAPAVAQQPPAPPPPLPPARIIVTGEGSVTVPPDYAEIASGATNQAKTAKEASDANAKVIIALNAALKNDGIVANDVQTLRFSVSPVYGTPQQNSPPKLVGFSVSNELRIKVRQIGRVGEILDSLIQAGATDSGSVQFLHSNMSQVLDRARQAAMADARRKAELYAQSAGLKLGGVAWVTEVPASAAPTPFPMRAYGAAAAVPISAGADTLNVQITVGFEAAR